MNEFAAVTIVAHNYLPQARILAESFKKHHPDSTFYIVLVDRPVEARLINEGLFTVLPITEIDFGQEGYTHMASYYDVTEFATSTKPFVLRQLTREHRCVFYIDPDIKVFSPLTPLIEKTLEVGWSLTPHALQPIVRNGWQPTEEEIKGAGVYNLGYIGVTSKSTALLDWWCERLRHDCIIDVPRQLFTDQRWIDLAVAMWPVHIERTTSYNVAYWNLDQRKVWKQGDQHMVDDDVLRFFHFSGYDPLDPSWISKYQIGRPRVLLSDQPVVSELCEEYGRQMFAVREEIAHRGSYGWGDVVPGFPWSKALRRFLRTRVLMAEAGEVPMPPNPYDAGGAHNFIAWLRGADEIIPQLPRYVAGIYLQREDLQQHFPEGKQGKTEQLTQWIRRKGIFEDPTFRAMGDVIHPPVSTVLQVNDVSQRDGGIDVYGYLRAELGVGEAGRLAVAALRSADVGVSTISDSFTLSRQNFDFPTDNEARHSTVLMAVNADQLPLKYETLGDSFFKKRHVIGQWFWELEEFPDRNLRSFDLVDELWAPTQFIAQSLRAKAPKNLPIHHMPLPLLPPTVASGFSRNDLGIPNRYMFLFTFDFLSVLKRKNAMGLIDAFSLAFSPNEGPILVLKTINGDKRMRELEMLRWHARNRPDVFIIDTYLENDQTAALMNDADCYVSLHRSEGLGLTMAEAMLLGKPVIATAYSGNMDFMTEDTALLVPWIRTKVGNDGEGYPANCEWAEPNLAKAAEYMRQVFDVPKFGQTMGSRAQADLLSRFSPEACGNHMKSRLQEIWSK
jgi:glycosyltransferase involved in cell wall biosynthesis